MSLGVYQDGLIVNDAPRASVLKKKLLKIKSVEDAAALLTYHSYLDDIPSMVDFKQKMKRNVKVFTEGRVKEFYSEGGGEDWVESGDNLRPEEESGESLEENTRGGGSMAEFLKNNRIGKDDPTPQESIIEKKITLACKKVVSVEEKFEEEINLEKLEFMMKNMEVQQRMIQEININSQSYEDITSEIISIMTDLEENMLNRKIFLKEDKEVNDKTKKTQEDLHKKLLENHSIPNLESSLDTKRWVSSVTNHMPLKNKTGKTFLEPNVAQAYAEKLKKSVKVASLSTTIRHMSCPEAIVNTVVKACNISSLNTAGIAAMGRATAKYPYKTSGKIYWEWVLGAIAEALAVLTSFEEQLGSINEKLYDILKNRVLVGSYRRSLFDYLQQSNSVLLSPDMAQGVNIHKLKERFRKISNPQKVDYNNQISSSEEEKETHLMIMAVVFEDSAKNIQREQIKGQVENKRRIKDYNDSVLHLEDEVSESEEPDPEQIYLIEENNSDVRKAKEVAKVLEERAKEIFFSIRQGKKDVQGKWEARLKACPIKCGTKHYSASLRYCYKAILKDRKEIQNLLKLASCSLCKLCYTPGHDSGSCKLKHLICGACKKESHSLAFCPNTNLQEKVEALPYIKQGENLYLLEDQTPETEPEQLHLITDKVKKDMIFSEKDQSYFELDFPRISHLNSIQEEREEETTEETDSMSEESNDEEDTLLLIGEEEKVGDTDLPESFQLEENQYINMETDTLLPMAPVADLLSYRPLPLSPPVHLDFPQPPQWRAATITSYSSTQDRASPLTTGPPTREYKSFARIILFLLLLLFHQGHFMGDLRHRNMSIRNSYSYDYLNFNNECNRGNKINHSPFKQPSTYFNSITNLYHDQGGHGIKRYRYQKNNNKSEYVGWPKFDKTLNRSAKCRGAGNGYNDIKQPDQTVQETFNFLICGLVVLRLGLSLLRKVGRVIACILLIFFRGHNEAVISQPRWWQHHPQSKTYRYDNTPNNKKDERLLMVKSKQPSSVRKIQPVQSLWVASEVFDINEERCKGFHTKMIDGRKCVLLNVLYDTGSTLNVLSNTVASMVNAKTGLDANRTYTAAQGVPQKGFCNFTNALIFNENIGKFMKIGSLHITERPFRPLMTSPKYIKWLVREFLQPFMGEKRFNVPIYPAETHILLGQSAMQTFSESYLTGKHEDKFPLLNIVKSFWTKGYYLTGMIDHACLDGLKPFIGKRKTHASKSKEDHICQLQECCNRVVGLNLMNDTKFDAGCEKHSFSLVCDRCVVLSTTQKTDITLEEVYGLLRKQGTKKGQKFVGHYSWIERPEIHFLAEKSNKTEAYRHAKKKVAAMIKTNPEALGKLRDLQEKYIAEGAYRVLTPAEESEVLKQPHHFLRHSYTINEKSMSTRIRHILDPASLDSNTNTSVNLLLHDLPIEYLPIPVILQSYRLYEYGVSLDIKSMFHTIAIDKKEQPFQLIASFDFSKADYLNNPITLCCQVLPFGNKQSPAIADAAVNIVTQEMPEPAKSLMTSSRVVDNVAYSRRKREEAKEIAKTMGKHLEKNDMHLKPGDFSGGEQGVDQTVFLLGYAHNLKTDKLGHAWTTNLTPKVKGTKKGPDLTVENMDDQPEITKRVVCRVLNSYFDPLGIMSQFWILELKHFFSRVCKVFEPTELDIPLKKRIPKLEQDFKKIMAKIIRIDCTQNIERAIMKNGEYISHLFVSLDGSEIGFSTCQHVRIINRETGKVKVSLIRAANKHEDKLSIPSHEIHAFRLAVKVLNETLLAFKTFMEVGEFGQLKVVIGNDSLSTSLQLLNGANSKVHSRLAKNINQEISDLVKSCVDAGLKYPFQFVWLKSGENPSDFNSKIQDDYAAVPMLWLQGPGYYAQPHLLDPVTWAWNNGTFRQNSEFLPWKWQVRDQVMLVMDETGLTQGNFKPIVRNAVQPIWIPDDFEAGPYHLSKELYQTLTTFNNTYLSMLCALSRILQAVDKMRKRVPPSHAEYLHRACGMVLRASQEKEKPKLPRSIQTEVVQGVICSTIHLGDTMDHTNMTLSTPIVQEKDLAVKILVSVHALYMPVLNRCLHRNKSGTIAASRTQPICLHILNVSRLADEVISTCSMCNKSRKIAFKRQNIRFGQFYKSGGATYFSAISVDIVGHVMLKGARSNHTKKSWVLVILCLRSGMVEFFVIEKISTRAVLVALLTHQNRNGPILEIVSDHGSQLKKLDMSYASEYSGEDTRVLTMLMRAVAANPHQQNMNLVEGAIRKMKVILETLSLSDNKKLLENLDKSEFELLLSYVKMVFESVPFHKDTLLCPRNLRGVGIKLPWELKENIPMFGKALSTIKEVTWLALQAIENAALGNVNFFYQITNNPNGPVPEVGDIILLSDQGKLEKKKRLARITKLGKTSLVVELPNKKTRTYPRSDAVLIYRPAWHTDSLLQPSRSPFAVSEPRADKPMVK